MYFPPLTEKYVKSSFDCTYIYSHILYRVGKANLDLIRVLDKTEHSYFIFKDVQVKLFEHCYKPLKIIFI